MNVLAPISWVLSTDLPEAGGSFSLKVALYSPE